MSQALVKKPDTVESLLVKMKGEILKALPKHMTGDRLARIALTELRKVPGLLTCDPLSFIGAIMQCAQLGLEPGSGLGHAYLIPFKNKKLGIVECTFIAGYKGLVELARRSGKIDSVSSRVVWSSDEFEYEYGDDERIRHKPGEETDDRTITHVYAIARLKGLDEPQREVMTRGQIDRIRDRFSHGNPVWENDFDEMARKTAVRRLSKYLPLSPELADLFTKEDAVTDGKGQENWKLIAPDYEPQRALADPEKFAEVAADTTTPPAMEHEKRTAAEDVKAAMVDFEAAVKVVRNGGGDVNALLQGRFTEIVTSGSAAKLRAGTDILCRAK